jgi:hypothetical protein
MSFVTINIRLLVELTQVLFDNPSLNGECIADCRLPTADCRLPTADCRLWI